MGIANAAVFPEPVFACTMRSLLPIAIGMVYYYTGVGFKYLHFSMFSLICLLIFSSLKC